MKPEDYAKLLLESSFKEADNTWKRSTPIFAFQSVILGFLANSLGTKPIESGGVIILSFMGFLGSVFSFLIIRVSEYYNSAWYDATLDWVKVAGDEDDAKIWRHLEAHLINHEDNLPFPRWHSSHIFKVLCIFLAMFWIFILVYACFRRLNLGSFCDFQK